MPSKAVPRDFYTVHSGGVTYLIVIKCEGAKPIPELQEDADCIIDLGEATVILYLRARLSWTELPIAIIG